MFIAPWKLLTVLILDAFLIITVLQVYSVEIQQPPYFNVTPTSMTYPVAKIVRLKCHALGFPVPTISWLKDGKALPQDPRIKITNYELILSTSYTYDAGTLNFYY